MNKENLINVIQNEKTGLDEREMQIRKTSYRIGYSSGFFIITILLFIRIIVGVDFAADLLMIIVAQISIISLYEYIKNKDGKGDLYLSIIGFLVTIGCLYGTLVYYEVF